MTNIKHFALLLLFLPLGLWAQQANTVKGKVVEYDANNKPIPLIGVNVYWLGTNHGVATDLKGEFTIDKRVGSNYLVVSYVGYKNDTVDVREQQQVFVAMQSNVEIDAVRVVKKKKTTEISMLTPLKVEKIGEDELLKAACCNLSESFETSPTVDVSFTDAITGTRQIQMLGLAGPTIQFTRENMPDIRGLSSIYGLTFIPGTWIESIQLNKGTGSVLNGYESIAGQINVELRKPETAEKLYLNLYGNESGRAEANLNLVHKFTDGKWSTALLLHAKNNSVEWDHNKDSFLDKPLGSSYIALNRWKYTGDNGLRMQFGLRGTYSDKTGGQFSNEPISSTDRLWKMDMTNTQLEGWAKIGKVYENMPWKSMALQLSSGTQSQDSRFGNTIYDARQNSMYGNFIYQSIMGNTNHKFKTGASFVYDDFNEQLADTAFVFQEIVPGAYFEYTYSHMEKFSAVAGIRADYHNLHGAFATPRLHVRYAPYEKLVFRASAGYGQRTSHIFAENNNVFATSRQVQILGGENDKPYGLDPEKAWNYGINVTKKFTLDFRDGAISVDYYFTDFRNQVVLDLENPRYARFYNLDGQSFSKSIQAQIDYELIKRLDVRLAYRWYDVKTQYGNSLLQRPLIATDRAFINLAFETRKHWKFDYTLNWQGPKRIPSTLDNPQEFRRESASPAFFIMNAQISKSWNEKLELYVGGENLAGYKQDNPIIASSNPFGEYFDSSLIWGPIFGRNIYFGLRYRIR